MPNKTPNLWRTLSSEHAEKIGNDRLLYFGSLIFNLSLVFFEQVEPMRKIITPCKRKHCQNMARWPMVYCSKACAPLAHLSGNENGVATKEDFIFGGPKKKFENVSFEDDETEKK